MRTRVFGSDDITVADDRDFDGSLDGGDAGPVGLAGVALLAGAGMQGDGVEAAIFGEFGHGDGHQVVIAPAGAVLHGERDGDGGADLAEHTLHQGQIAQQAGTAVALDHFVDRAAEVEIEDIEPEVLADTRRFGQDRGVGAEELGGDGVLVRVEAEISLQGLIGLTGFERRADTVGAGELSHDQAAAAEVANETAEDGIGHAGHGGEDGCRREGYRADRKLCGKVLHGDAALILSSEE